MHSYAWGKDHEVRLHDISYLPVPPRDEITVDDFEEGTTREVEMHDGSLIKLKKLESDYDPTDRWHALRVLEDAERDNYMVTGLIFVDTESPSIFSIYDLPKQALNRMTEAQLRPSRESLDKINAEMF
jgi:2-oxoglutarate ferredoxin oxidoreductase subunit beta